MPKLPVLKPKELKHRLEKLGFVLDHQVGSHAVLYRIGDRKRVVVPMHTKDIPKGTLAAILKESGIEIKEITK